MFCAKCGKNIPEGTKFCGGCGEKMDSPLVQSDPETVEAPTYVSSQPAYDVPPQPAYAPPQPAYATPKSHQQGAYKPSQYGTEPLSVGNYIGTILLLGVPLLGFILLLVWAFDGSTNINKKNLARAILILSVIGIVLWIIVGGLFVGSLGYISR